MVGNAQTGAADMEPAMTNAEHRRQMTGNMPTGEYKLADQRFSVKRIEPEKEPEMESLGHWGLFPVESD